MAAVRSPFPIDNLPFGIATVGDGPARVVVAVGEQALDMAALATGGALDGTVPEPGPMFATATLNPFLAAGRSAWSAVRQRLQELLTDPTGRNRIEPALLPQTALAHLLPFAVGDYVDFYSSLDHATNVGRIFRPDGEPLAPNWRHLPVGYHGRAGTVVVSGTPVVRPVGLRPTFGPSAKLDFEAEVGFVIGTPTELGEHIPTGAFREHVFGVVLVNDWSARDIQAFESRPLGPFLAKSFATTISPWVVPLDALDSVRVPPPSQQPAPALYLRCDEPWGLDLQLEIEINGSVVSRPPYAGMYWTMPQQLAHATVNGAAVRTGDLFASGTVSGPERDQRGCLLELTWDGTEPITLDDGSTRTYLEDGDTVVVRSAGFGECVGRVQPAGLLAGG